MNQYFDNSDHTANFTAAYEAGMEERQRAPFKMPVSINRKRRSRNDRALPRLGFWESVDRRHASELHQESALATELYETPKSPEDMLNDMIDGTLDPESRSLISGEDFQEPALERELVPGLSDQEIQLVLQFSNDDEELHPTKEKVINPPTTQRLKFWNLVYNVDEQTSLSDKSHAEYLARTAAERECGTFRIIVQVKPEPASVDREDETEAHRASDEFKRACQARSLEVVCAKRFAPHNNGRKRSFLNDTEHRSTIRGSDWTHQFVSNRYELREYLEDLWNEAELAHRDCKEAFEGQQGAEAEAELEAWEEEIRLAQEEQCILREAELLEETPQEIDAFDPYLIDHHAA
jgi:hypothetical protein